MSIESGIPGVNPRAFSSDALGNLYRSCVLDEAQGPYQTILIGPLQLADYRLEKLYNLGLQLLLVQLYTQNIRQRVRAKLTLLPRTKLHGKLFRHLEVARRLVAQHQLLIATIATDKSVPQIASAFF